MKILLICSGCASRLPLAEFVLRKKLKEAEVAGIEVESAGIADWGVAPQKEEDNLQKSDSVWKVVRKNVTDKLLEGADLILVMERKQRDFITQFVDYSRWGKIHLFMDYCLGKNEDQVDPETEKNVVYKRAVEQVEEACQKLVENLKMFLHDSSGKKSITNEIIWI